MVACDLSPYLVLLKEKGDDSEPIYALVPLSFRRGVGVRSAKGWPPEKSPPAGRPSFYFL
jgi:hypothetical protein